MLSKEEIEKQILNTETRKHPLLNEIYAIRDRRKETQDYTIYVDGYISVDVLNETLQLESKEQKLIEKLEKDIVNITKTMQDGKHCDDYSRCRLKAYRTKTKEILEILKGEKE